ncbi:helix-turn-helix domain-containing protein [Actinomadura sp. NPDC000600]|uniref:AraC family transcriptional regulator n=1 Tax=Actinomadura sp. NPDC000600 TaxID=3154262 RepID=UPI00339B7616
MVLRGPCWLIPEEGEPFPLAVGDVVFLPHAGRHGLADAPSTPLAEHVCDPREGPRFERRYAAPPVGRAPAGASTTVTLCGAYELDAARVHPLLDTLLLYILRAWFADQPADGGATGWAAALADPAVSAALGAIHDDPARPWTVASLGAHAGLSRAAFSRRFTALVGRPPLAYLTWWRLTTAMRLLRDSDAPLSAVAEQVGYASEFSFANAFKREFGVSPGRHRRDSRTPGRPDRTEDAEPSSGREAFRG